MWYLSLFLFPTVSSLLLNNDNYDRSIAMADFAHQIFANECSNCKTVLVVHSGQELACELFLKRTVGAASLYMLSVDGNGTTLAVNNVSSITYTPDLTMIFIDTDIVDTVEIFVFAVELLPVWNIRGRFLIVTDGEGVNEDLDTWLQETFELFWETQILKVLVAIQQEDKEISTFTFDPYKENYKIKVPTEDRLTLWFNRRVTNMYGKPLKLYQFDLVLKEEAVKRTLPDGSETWVGRDGMYYSVLAKALNTTLLVHGLSEDFSDDMIRNADPSLPLTDYIGLFSDIFDFDALFNSMPTFSDNAMNHVFLYERNDWRVLVPKAGIVPQYLYVMMLVPVNVWAATLITLVSVAIARKVLGGSKATPVLDNVSFLLGTTAPNRSRMQSPERFLLTLWMYGCLVLDTLFQATLMSTLVAPKYYTDINTIEAFSNTDMKVYGPIYTNIQMSRIMLSGHDARFMQHVRNVPRHITVYGDDHLEWINMYMDKNAIILKQQQAYRILRTIPGLLDTHHVIAENLIPNAVAFNMPSNKRYFEEILRVFNTIQEAGLHIYWRDYDHFLNREVIKSNTTTIYAEEKNQILTLFHLQSAFFLLILGLSSSVLVFCCEKLCFRARTKRIEYMN